MDISSEDNGGSLDPKLQANKKIAMAFFEAGLNEKDLDAASKFFGERYVQHNPLIADSLEGFEAFLSFLTEKFPELRGEVERVFAEGD